MRDFDKEINELEQRIAQVKSEQAKAAANNTEAKARAAAKKLSDTVDACAGKLFKCLQDVIQAGDYTYSEKELQRILPSERGIGDVLSAIVVDTLMNAEMVKNMAK